MLEIWKKVLSPITETREFKEFYDSISKLYTQKTIVPKKDQILKSLAITDLYKIRVVIMGQDPYPNKEHATGLAFGIPRGMYLPRTLINICNEVEADVITEDNDSKNKRFINRNDLTLEGWADQGVLLLNSSLTTEEGIVGAHTNLGWEKLTDAILFAVKQRKSPVVFMLWGEEAAKKEKTLLVNGGIPNYIKILTSTHPSPLSYNRGVYINRFQGCGHFLEANKWLRSKGLEPIDWSKTGRS